MKTRSAALGVALSIGLSSVTYAQAPSNATPIRDAQAQAVRAIELPKDPLVAAYLSATLPGLGQIYANHPKRGVLFMLSIAGAFGAAYAAYEPAVLNLADYDRPSYGGNADGLVSTVEAQNWEDRKFQDTAFDSLSTNRKAVLISGALVGASLYVWNLFDASAQARAHNRTLASSRVSMGLEASPHAVGVAVAVRLPPSGR